MYQNNNIMEAINTKLFTLNELKNKSYSNLYSFITGLIEVAIELEVGIESIEIMEDETGAIDNNMLEALNHLTTQLDYINRNISTATKAMAICEDESFFKINNMVPICLN